MGDMKDQITRIEPYKKYFKRLLDIILSFCALVVLSPLLLFVAILVRIKLGSPVIFKQQRPGLHEKIFTLYKFRTMTDQRDADNALLPDSVRLTKFGRMLRSTSIDELPELCNVIRGEMSIVGPRPLMVQYLGRYDEHQKRRHELRPGLTGYAQVNGRNAVSWEQRFDYDVYHVDHISFWGDVKIIFQTVKIVFKREGITSENAATMEEFMGTPSNENVKTDTGEEL